MPKVVAVQGQVRFMVWDDDGVPPADELVMIVDLDQRHSFELPFGAAIGRGYWEEPGDDIDESALTDAISEFPLRRWPSSPHP
jgi:hypothetical protein